MTEFTYTMQDPLGMHARPAGQLAKKATAYASTVTVCSSAGQADTRRLMSLMGLCIKCGDTITLQIDGPDEGCAATALLAFMTEQQF